VQLIKEWTVIAVCPKQSLKTQKLGTLFFLLALMCNNKMYKDAEWPDQFISGTLV
jgi:hypothetical protein